MAKNTVIDYIKFRIPLVDKVPQTEAEVTKSYDVLSFIKRRKNAPWPS